MKKIFFAIAFFTNFYLFAQGECGVIYNDNDFQVSIPSSLDTPPNYEPIVFNLFFHVITNTDGTRPIPIPESYIMKAVENLNYQFYNLRIFFKYRGYNEIRNSTFMNVVRMDEPGIDNSYFDLIAYNNEHHEYYDDKCYDIFIMPSIDNGLIGAAAQVTGQHMIITDNNITSRFLIAHEMGHSFNLYHTDNTNNGACCENVTRDVNDINYNATTKGDFVHDTPATPFGFQIGTVSNCIWTGTAYDTSTPPVQYPNVTLDNIMHSRSCQNIAVFTPLQGARMRASIASINTYASYQTDISSLYEPFDARVIPGNVVSADDQPDNGGAYVCRAQKYRLRFQPGFQCYFTDAPSGTIFQHYWQQFNFDNSFDHNIGVTIPVLGEQTIYTGGISSVTPYLCGFEPYITGTVYSMEVLGQMNISVKELNEIEVRDPDLYKKLMSQYYYILKKITSTGVETEKTFYKY